MVPHLVPVGGAFGDVAQGPQQLGRNRTDFGSGQVGCCNNPVLSGLVLACTLTLLMHSYPRKR